MIIEMSEISSHFINIQILYYHHTYTIHIYNSQQAPYNYIKS